MFVRRMHKGFSNYWYRHSGPLFGRVEFLLGVGREITFVGESLDLTVFLLCMYVVQLLLVNANPVILVVVCLFQGIDIVKSEPIRKFYSGLAKVDSPFQGMRGLKPSPSSSSSSSSSSSPPSQAALPSALKSRVQKSGSRE